MMRPALDMLSACASVLATIKSTPCSPDTIMLLTALPPAPPTPNTMMRAFISRISVMLVISASRFVRQARNERIRSLPISLAVPRDTVSPVHTWFACCYAVAVHQSINSATAPQKPFKPRCRLLGRHGLGGRLQQLDHQPIGTLALPLEIYPITGRRCFEPDDLRLQCHDL